MKLILIEKKKMIAERAFDGSGGEEVAVALNTDYGSPKTY